MRPAPFMSLTVSSVSRPILSASAAWSRSWSAIAMTWSSTRPLMLFVLTCGGLLNGLPQSVPNPKAIPVSGSKCGQDSMRSTPMTESDELAARLRRLEDDRDIRQLIASYGPAVDAGDADAAARLWATDGIYDVDGWRMEGRADVHA